MRSFRICTLHQMKSGMTRWAEYIARMSEMRNVYEILVGKSEEKRPLEIPRRKSENIKINLKNR
jgi:hypothetical protein